VCGAAVDMKARQCLACGEKLPPRSQIGQPGGSARLVGGLSTFGLGLFIGIVIGTVLGVSLVIALVIFG
jgi:hypothetical protein